MKKPVNASSYTTSRDTTGYSERGVFYGVIREKSSSLDGAGERNIASRLPVERGNLVTGYGIGVEIGPLGRDGQCLGHVITIWLGHIRVGHHQQHQKDGAISMNKTWPQSGRFVKIKRKLAAKPRPILQDIQNCRKALNSDATITP